MRIDQVLERRSSRGTDSPPAQFEANPHHSIAATRASGALSRLVTLPHSLRRDLSPMDLYMRARQFPYFYAGNATGDIMDLIDRYNEAIRRVARVEAVPVAEGAVRFDRMTRKRDRLLDTMHPNSRGHILIAEVLERTLRGEGMLERPADATDFGREE